MTDTHHTSTGPDDAEPKPAENGGDAQSVDAQGVEATSDGDASDTVASEASKEASNDGMSKAPLEQPDAKGEAMSNTELQQHVRRNLRLTVISLAVFFAVVFALFYFLQDWMLIAAQWTAENIGFAGLAAFVFFSDTFISPVPGDVTLVVIKGSDLKQHEWLYVTLLGAASSIGGMLGWLISWKLGNTSIPTKLFGDSWIKTRDRFSNLMRKHGLIVVAVGAITPFPFSITCWMAGLFRMPAHIFMLATLLRIPRYLFYYWLVLLAKQAAG